MHEKTLSSLVDGTNQSAVCLGLSPGLSTTAEQSLRLEMKSLKHAVLGFDVGI